MNLLLIFLALLAKALSTPYSEVSRVSRRSLSPVSVTLSTRASVFILMLFGLRRAAVGAVAKL